LEGKSRREVDGGKVSQGVGWRTELGKRCWECIGGKRLQGRSKERGRRAVVGRKAFVREGNDWREGDGGEGGDGMERGWREQS